MADDKKLSTLGHLKLLALRCYASTTAKISELASSVSAAIEEIDAVKADKTAGVFYIKGTGTTAGTWLGSHEDSKTYHDGLMIAYKTSIAGATSTSLNINGLGAVAVVRNATTAVTTQYAAGSVLFLTYTVDSGGTAYWKIADYDSNTKNTAGSSNKTSTKLFLIGGASQSSSGVTTYSNTGLYLGTDNKLYCSSGFAGALTGNAATATKATQDGSGNVITDTYATKSDIGDINTILDSINGEAI